MEENVLGLDIQLVESHSLVSECREDAAGNKWRPDFVQSQREVNWEHMATRETGPSETALGAIPGAAVMRA